MYRSNSAASRPTSSLRTVTWTRPFRGWISGIFAATGQTCIAGSRVLVQNSGSGRHSPSVWWILRGRHARGATRCCLIPILGPVTTAPQFRKFVQYIDIAKAEGPGCILGGGPADIRRSSGRTVRRANNLTDVTRRTCASRGRKCSGQMYCSILGFEDEADAIRLCQRYDLRAGRRGSGRPIWAGRSACRRR